MVVNKRKKVNKYRAHTTHGGGHRKKRRGAGSRGGKGNAGSGKRAGHKKIGKVLGRNGFTPRRTVSVITSVNVGYFTNSILSRFLNEGKIEQKNDVFVLDLAKLGFDKLLGTGKISAKLEISTKFCSAHAKEKVEAAGGTVNIVLAKQESGEKLKSQKSEEKAE